MTHPSFTITDNYNPLAMNVKRNVAKMKHDFWIKYACWGNKQFTRVKNIYISTIKFTILSK